MNGDRRNRSHNLSENHQHIFYFMVSQNCHNKITAYNEYMFEEFHPCNAKKSIKSKIK